MERREPSFFRGWANSVEAVEAYGFTFRPSFSYNKSFSASLWKTHSGKLYGSMSIGGMGSNVGYDHIQGVARENQRSGDLDPIAWRVLQETLERIRFWTDEEWIRMGGRDGADWYFDGLKEGQYLFRKAWSPYRGDPAYELGRFFFSLVPSDFAFVVYDEHSRERFEGIALYKGIPTIFVS